MKWFKEKKLNIIYFLISLFIIIVSYLVNINFREVFLRKISESFFWLTIPILFFSIIVFFVKNNTFLSWARMTKYFFTISFLIILMTPTFTHGLDFVPIVKETVTIVLAIIYSITSILLILYKSLQKE